MLSKIKGRKSRGGCVFKSAIAGALGLHTPNERNKRIFSQPPQKYIRRWRKCMTRMMVVIAIEITEPTKPLP